MNLRKLDTVQRNNSESLPLDRERHIDRMRANDGHWDIVVIGGGATGIGIALDAATRGLSVVLVEQSDFGKGTSSRSTKLVHGGVRYLRQGNMTLVRDALRERTRLKDNAPGIVHDLSFLIPCQSRWEIFFYGVGMKLYDLLAASHRFGRSRHVSLDETRRLVPTLRSGMAVGGVVYHDGQFDDTRLLIAMAKTAANHGACLINYARVEALQKDSTSRVAGVEAIDLETGDSFSLRGRCIINATGPFCDSIRKLDDDHAVAMLAVSRGIHIVLERRFLPGETAIIVPKTKDGRVIFIIPWYDRVLVGTTDTPMETPMLEPQASEDEIEFLLETTAEYLAEPPTRADILSVFAGIRPLVKGDPSARTASLSRDHVIRRSDSGLLTITGGKWTTVRKMAEDCVDRAIRESGLQAGRCCTETLSLEENRDSTSPISPFDFTDADIVYSIRNEMARTVEDFLARRTRALFLDARAALELMPRVTQVMANELKQDDSWIEVQTRTFTRVAAGYLPSAIPS